MANRILDISESPAQLRVRHENLIVELQGEQSHSVPLADIAVLVISHPQVRFTHAVVSGMVERGGVLITCGANRLPVGMLLPLVAHFAQAERFAAQARATNSVASVKLRTLVFRQFGVGSWDKGSRPWSPMGDQGQVAAVMPAVSVAPPLALHAVDPYRGSGGGPIWCPQCDAAWPPRASTHCGHRETPPPPAFGGESPA